MPTRVRIAIGISGGGTTMREIIRATKRKNGILNNAEVGLVVGSAEGLGGTQKAYDEGMSGNIELCNPKDFQSPEDFGEELLRLMRLYAIDIWWQCGWMPKTPKNFIEGFKGPKFNQHPGPLDHGHLDFGGKGWYGRRVHAGVLAFRRQTGHDMWTEATAHFVEPGLDKGHVIKSQRIRILPGEDVITLQQRVLPIEHRVQIAAIRDVVNRDVKIITREKRLINRSDEYALVEAAHYAGLLFPHG